MPQIDYFGKNSLSNLWDKISSIFVRKEYKTGSQSVYKVLSDNNLTDDLVAKINNAGDSSFTGNYADLTGKPVIEGHELASGSQTAASLGLATPSDVSDAVSTATQGMATQSWVTSQNYQTQEQVSQTVSTATANMATQSWVQGLGYQDAEQVQTAINTSVASAFTYKGTKATVSELPQSDNKVGDVWHVTEDDGEYAWDGTQWEALGGNMDMSAYVLHSEMVEIDEDAINEICV